MRGIKWATLAMLLACSAVMALTVQPPPPPPERLPPIRVLSPDTRTPVVLQALSVQVEVAAGVATTRYHLTLHNPNAQDMEGTIELPLAGEQQVVGFALDIGEEMREAVAVPKDKGQAVFEAIERRQVDPGLLEQTGGNNYRLRVYPVPGKGRREASITVMEPVSVADGRAQLPLPLVQRSGLNEVTLNVQGVADLRIEGSSQTQDVRQGSVQWQARLRPAQFAQAPRLVWTTDEKQPEVLIQQDGSESFALIGFKPDAAAATTRKVERLGLLWDASLSGAEHDHSLEIATLEQFLKAADTTEVRLVLLRDRPEAARVLQIHNGDTSELRAALQAVVYDGASNPGGWESAGIADWLYVGDGRFNYGDAKLPLPANTRLDVLADSRSHADTPRLAAWSEASGGKLVMIDGIDSLSKAATRLAEDAARIERIEVLGGTDAIAQSHWQGVDGRFQIALKLASPKARVRVHWRDAKGRHEKTFELDGAAHEGRLAGRLWARWQMQHWQLDTEGNRSRLQQLGERFGIVNAESSLIVLETLEDYLRYAITPPPGLLPAYQAAMQNREAEQRSTRQQRLDEVAKSFALRIQWWESDWPKTARPRIERNKRRDIDVAADAAAEAAAAAAALASASREMDAPAPPPPPPAPSMAVIRSEAPAESESLDSIMVSGTRLVEKASAAQDIPDTIHIQPWQPDSPAARRMQQAAPAQRYAVYLDLRQSNRMSPAFYLDAAQQLAAAGERELALRMLSNLAELQIEDRHLLRVLAYRLVEMDAAELAVPLLLRVRALADEEPQSHRDLGLALAKVGQYQEAADSLYRVVAGDWDHRFRGIAMIALTELNALIAAQPQAINTAEYDRRLLRNLPLGLRTVLTWDADNSDMDLWVTDPDGEKAYYGHRRTYQGGLMSEDFTGGYGPEEFALRKPKPGIYKVEVDYFGDRHQIVTGETTLQLWLSTGFGTARQQDRIVSLRLKGRGEKVLVGEFEVK